ncbi:ribonuclease P protein component [Pannus brasiliensis CCIBt3594]|uniref:Ribonuclease P protein component n=1 Tax=Pannus brasiliensis CCIBt3594 TaxID=1427578 RepID=A0AAW9QVC8_9CHRO
MGLPRVHRLRHRRDFQAVYEGGKRYHGSDLTVIARQDPPIDPPLPSRFGLSVSVKVSKKAVVRNRLKRQLRAVIRELLPEITAGWRAIVVVRPSAVGCNSEHFLRELEQLLVKANIIHGH